VLKTIEAVLKDLDLGIEPAQLRYCISISNGNTISVGAFTDAGPFYQIKACETPAFEDEYRAQMRGWEQHGDVVPKPIGRRVRDGWDLFVAQGVHHQPLIFNPNGTGQAIERLLDDLSHFFEVSAKFGKNPDAKPLAEQFLDVLEQHFKSSPFSSVAAYWIDQGRSLGVCDQPLIDQHGDFVVNNVAYSGRQLIVFDWEDFGKYQLPGLDICSFCFSAIHKMQDLRALMTSEKMPTSAIGIFVSRTCTASGLDPDLFRRLLPLHLLGFLYAKREYSDAVQSRIRSAITQLSAPFNN
jgi:hypothetical protein